MNGPDEFEKKKQEIAELVERKQYRYARRKTAEGNVYIHFSHVKNGPGESLNITEFSQEEQEELIDLAKRKCAEMREGDQKKQTEKKSSRELLADVFQKAVEVEREEGETEEGGSKERVDEDFILKLITSKKDYDRPVLLQWLRTHAEWNELLLSIGLSAYRLYAITRAGGDLKTAAEIITKHNNIDELVDDFEKYFTALIEAREDAAKLLELEEELEVYKARDAMLKQICYRAVAQRDAAYQLLQLAIKSMSRKQIESFIQTCAIMSMFDQEGVMNGGGS